MWPFKKKIEKRQDSSDYTDAVLAYLTSISTDGVNPRADISSGAEMAAGIISRSFLNCEIRGSEVFNKKMLYEISRDLILYGASLWTPVRGEWTRAAYWNIKGGINRSSWKYQVDFHGPSTTDTLYSKHGLNHDDVFHCIYSSIPGRVWEGNSPIRRSIEIANMLSLAEKKTKEEFNATVAALIPAPLQVKEGDADPYREIKMLLSKLGGRSTIVENFAGGMGNADNRTGGEGWNQKRIGPSPPQGIVEVLKYGQNSVAQLMGIPAALINGEAAGPALREANRQFLYSTIKPLARLVEYEWHRTSMEKIKINCDPIMASDLSGRARAFQSLVGGGMEIEKAAGLAGLMERDAE